MTLNEVILSRIFLVLIKLTAPRLYTLQIRYTKPNRGCDAVSIYDANNYLYRYTNSSKSSKSMESKGTAWCNMNWTLSGLYLVSLKIGKMCEFGRYSAVYFIVIMVYLLLQFFSRQHTIFMVRQFLSRNNVLSCIILQPA